MNKSLLACATLIGTIIGAGVFAIPYVFSQSGVITCLVYFLVVAIAVTLLHLFFGEIVLRTKEESRLSGFAGRYLGKKAKVLVGLALIIGTVGSLLVYIILSGQFLKLVFPHWLSVFQFSLLAWLVLSFLVFCGTRSIAWLELLLASALFLTAGVVIVFCLPKIQLHNFSLFNPGKLFLPFGVFMFSLVGWSAVPESEDILLNKKQLKSVIIFALIACAIFYIIFGLVVTLTLIFLNCFMTASITCLTCAMDFVPVQTRFPDEKTSTADFGSFILKTSPGKVSGLYSVFGCVLASFVSGTGFSREVVATMF